MLITAAIFASIAALLHVYIFVMEAFLWTTPRVRGTFGTSPEEAEATKSLALNQGFYNLFLAIAAGVGVAFLAANNIPVGATLILVGAGSMALASIVLAITSPDKLRAAITQGVTPIIAVIALLIGLAA